MSNLIKKSIVVFVACITSIACKQNNDKNSNYADISVGDEMIAELTAPPFVPKPVGDRSAKKLIVNMEIKEIEGEMADGVKYVYWTFGGSVPLYYSSCRDAHCKRNVRFNFGGTRRWIASSG
jgi:nitrite reductase (NO-forming)